MATQATKKTAPKATPELAALEAEAIGSDITVDVRGVKFQVDPDVLDDADAFDALSNNMPFKMFSLLVPENKREELRDTCEKNPKSGGPKLSALVELTGEILQAVGAGK